MKFLTFLIKWSTLIVWLSISLLASIAAVVGINIGHATMQASAKQEAPEATYQYYYELWTVNPPSLLIASGLIIFFALFFGGKYLVKK